MLRRVFDWIADKFSWPEFDEFEPVGSRMIRMPLCTRIGVEGITSITDANGDTLEAVSDNALAELLVGAANREWRRERERALTLQAIPGGLL